MQFGEHIDTRNPLHAAAYLKAASHYLSYWPQSWSAECLALALVTEESPNRKHVRIWDVVAKSVEAKDDEFFYADSLISDLAESFIDFLNENK